MKQLVKQPLPGEEPTQFRIKEPPDHLVALCRKMVTGQEDGATVDSLLWKLADHPKRQNLLDFLQRMELADATLFPRFDEEGQLFLVRIK